MGVQLFAYLAVVILMLAVRGIVEAAGEECRITRCSPHGPQIRFPFWVKHSQPEHCSHPEFRVSCHKKQTILHFQYLANTSLQGTSLLLSVEVPVRSINYTSQQLKVAADTFPYYRTPNLKLVSSSMLPPYGNYYQYEYHDYHYNFIFLSCPSRVPTSGDLSTISVTSLQGQAFPVYYFEESITSGPSITSVYYLEDSTASRPSITSCTKVFNSTLPYEVRRGYGLDMNFAGDTGAFTWSTPNCSNIMTADNSTTCLPRGQHRGSIKPIAGLIPGATLIVLVLLALLNYIIRLYRQKKYDQRKIEMFLSDYKAMKPTRYSYADIKKITTQFSDKLGQGGYGSVYKGQITNDIIVAVKVLNSDPKANGEDFINEVGTIGRIFHVNVVRLVGYCADGCYRALVYEFQPNSSLEKFTYSGKNHQNNFLGWEKLQEIALGIAKGIEYLHQGCAQQILHFDIKPHNILLDQNFSPKISDFGLAKLCSKDQSIVSMTMMRGTIGYIAPEVYSRNFGKVSSKSDVYSFGMLLLEMVGARNNNTMENTSETYFPEWIFNRLEEGGDVAIQIEKDEDSNIARKLTVVGLWCIGWHPVDRPSMKHVMQMLERQECPPLPPNPFRSSQVRTFANDLEVISESE